MADLYQIKAENDEEEDAFMSRMRAAFEADDTVVPKSSDVEVPSVPSICPQDAQDAGQSAADFINKLDDNLTYIGWLTD